MQQRLAKYFFASTLRSVYYIGRENNTISSPSITIKKNYVFNPKKNK